MPVFRPVQPFAAGSEGDSEMNRTTGLVAFGNAILRYRKRLASQPTLQALTNVLFVAMRQLVTNSGAPCISVVNLGIRVGSLQLVAGGQHGQPGNHAVHVEAIRAAAARDFARLGQTAAIGKGQRHVAGAGCVKVLVQATLGMDTVEAPTT